MKHLKRELIDGSNGHLAKPSRHNDINDSTIDLYEFEIDHDFTTLAFEDSTFLHLETMLTWSDHLSFHLLECLPPRPSSRRFSSLIARALALGSMTFMKRKSAIRNRGLSMLHTHSVIRFCSACLVSIAVIDCLERVAHPSHVIIDL